MLAFVAAIPIVVVIVLMVGFRKKSGPSLMAAWGTAVILSFFFWDMNVNRAAALTGLGFLNAINVMLIIWCAIFLLNAMIKIKFVEAIGNGFNGISNDRRIQIIIIAYLFGAFVEGAAGFGTPGALAAPLLVGLGVPVFFAALSSLMANYSPVLFGAVGIPPITGFASIRPVFEGPTYASEAAALGMTGVEFADAVFRQLSLYAGFTNIIVGSFVPFLIIAAIVYRDGRGRGLKDAFNILPLALWCGLLFTVPVPFIYMITNSAEIPTLVSSLIALPLFIITVKKGFLVPKDVYRFVDDPIVELTAETKSDIPLSLAWSPYVIIAALLAITRLPQIGINRFLTGPDAFGVIFVPGIFGLELNFNLPLLNNPGLLPFLPITLIYLITRKVSGEDIKAIFKKTNKQLQNAALALFFGVAFVQILRFTTVPGSAIMPMATTIAQGLANVFGQAYPLVGPLIGALGAFVSGSHTVSNLMFYGLQLDTARFLELPAILIMMGQTSGASIGNMVAIHNAVSISATTGATGSEGKMISAAFVPFILCCLAYSAIMFAMLGLGVNFLI